MKLATPELYRVIRGARERRGLSQAAFARLLGVKPPVVSEWEGGAVGISEATLQKVAACFGVSLAALLREGLADLENAGPVTKSLAGD